MKYSKVILSFFMLISVLFMPVAHAEEKAIKVFFEGQEMSFNISPVIVNGTTLVQFRPIFEKLGLQITWDPELKRIQGKSSKISLEMFLDNNFVNVNGRSVYLEVAPRLVNGSTMVPLRFVGEASGKFVSWDPESWTVNIVKGFERNEDSNPYGGAGFIELNEIFNHQNIYPNMYEKDGYLYVIWSKEVALQDLRATNYFVSIAKDGQWITKNHSLAWLKRDNGVNYQSFFADGSIYWKDDRRITKITPTTTGYSSNMTIVADNLYANGQQESMRPIYVNGDIGVLYKVGSNLRIYTKDAPSSFVEVKDIFNVLNGLSSTASLVYDPTTKIINIIEDNFYRQLDVTTGDLKYGSDGKDLVIKLHEGARLGSIQRYFYNGTLYSFYLEETGGDLYRVATIDKKINVGKPKFTNIKQVDLQGKEVSVTDKDIKLWRMYEFNRKLSIELMSFSE